MSQDNYDLFSHTDSFLTRKKIKSSRKPSFYPSEASVKCVDGDGQKVIYGKCMRAAYLRFTNEVTPLPHDARTEFIFQQGKEVENMLVEMWKKMGLWVDNSVRFFNEKYNLSGELDVVLREPNGQNYIVEVKSFYGYFAKSQLIGNSRHKPFPKWDQLLQTLVYCKEFEDVFPYARMAYFARDSVDRTTFLVNLKEINKQQYPVVNGEIVESFSIDDIYSRFELLGDYVKSKSMPPKEYELQYDDNKIKLFRELGRIGKTKYEAWQKGKLKQNEYIGDWQCRYCGYRKHCYGITKAF